MTKFEKKREFHQIVGATLLDVDSSKATYHGLNRDGSTVSVLRFSFKLDKGCLTVENPFSLTVEDKILYSSDLEIFDFLRKLIGTRIEQAWFEREEISIAFGEAYLRISLRDKDFSSPEAGAFVSADNSIFIVFDGSN